MSIWWGTLHTFESASLLGQMMDLLTHTNDFHFGGCKSTLPAPHASNPPLFVLQASGVRRTSSLCAACVRIARARQRHSCTAWRSGLRTMQRASQRLTGRIQHLFGSQSGSCARQSWCAWTARLRVGRWVWSMACAGCRAGIVWLDVRTVRRPTTSASSLARAARNVWTFEWFVACQAVFVAACEACTYVFLA